MTDVKLFEEVFKFPSPYGVSFILIFLGKFFNEGTIPLVSVSLRSIIHSYQDVGYIAIEYKYIFRFPSPYGVSFILMRLESSYGIIARFKTFPSPYGVSFILIHFYLIS